jgi:hypothetical protein
VSFHPDVPDSTLHAHLSKAQRIWCLADRPQESYGIAPREALMYPKELVVMDHAAFVPPDHEGMGVTVIPAPPLRSDSHKEDAALALAPCLDSTAELVSGILRRPPIRITGEHMRVRLAYLDRIQSQFLPKLCSEPTILLRGEIRAILPQLDRAWVRNTLMNRIAESG